MSSVSCTLGSPKNFMVDAVGGPNNLTKLTKRVSLTFSIMTATQLNSKILSRPLNTCLNNKSQIFLNIKDVKKEIFFVKNNKIQVAPLIVRKVSVKNNESQTALTNKRFPLLLKITRFSLLLQTHGLPFVKNDKSQLAPRGNKSLC